jgi:hypothetical protein
MCPRVWSGEPSTQERGVLAIMDQRHHLDQPRLLMHEVPQLVREDVEVGASGFLTQAANNNGRAWIL